MNNLLVITGAGASYDLVHLSNNLVDRRFIPPLTKDLFNDEHTCISAVLKKNPIAAHVGYEFKNKKYSSPEQGLESYLKKIKNSERPTIKNQFWSIPLYLHDLFDEISRSYIRTAGGALPSN